MRIFKTYRFRIYPSAAQIERILRWQHALRWLWNIAHEQRLLGLARPRDERIYPHFPSQARELTQVRRLNAWLKDVPQLSCLNLLRLLDRAWDACFRRALGCPTWKKRGRDEFAVTHSYGDAFGCRVRGGIIRFPKLGHVLARVHRPLAGKPKTCAIKRDGDQWFASIVCEIDVPDPAPRIEPIVAIDRGITNVIADSDGRLVPNPKHFEKTLARLARAQRTVSRRKKGSKNREKAKLRVMRLHRKVRRQREHFLHVESARYAKSHGVVVIEKLNVAGLGRGHLARHIGAVGWGSFADKLRYKLAWSAGSLVEVPPQYSSQTCSACGYIDAKSRSLDSFSCTSCGHIDHADINAAKVLKSRANRSALPVEDAASNGLRRSRKYDHSHDNAMVRDALPESGGES